MQILPVVISFMWVFSRLAQGLPPSQITGELPTFYGASHRDFLLHTSSVHSPHHMAEK